MNFTYDLTPESARLLELDRIDRAATRCSELDALERWDWEESTEAEALSRFLHSKGIGWKLSR